MGMSRTDRIIRQTEAFGADNYRPLPVVLTQGEGAWVEDVEGRRYLDFLSGYSALIHGHRHPRIMAALADQAQRLTLTSRAFHHDKLGEFGERVAAMTGLPRTLPMNTGAEAVETAIKAARRWAYRVKGVPEGQAEIVVCDHNFHGRTIAVTSCSTEEAYREGFGPFTPGFVAVPFGDADALRAAIGPNTAALLAEPIQGEGGIVLPPDGYLREAAAICRERGALLMLDEIQTGFGRTGRTLAADHEGVRPDICILGKALGGGVLPVSAVAATNEVMDVFTPGSHGSTFGGNPLACAVAIAAIDTLHEERLTERSATLGDRLMERLRALAHPLVRELRGRGLFVGVELDRPARPVCERLMQRGLLCKETRSRVIRLAPPLVVTEAELDWAVEQLAAALTEEGGRDVC